VKVAIKLNGIAPDGCIAAEVEIDRVPLEITREEYIVLVNVLEEVKLRIREFIV
jgi:hypothetical protein